jgi:hypothetical protein
MDQELLVSDWIEAGRELAAAVNRDIPLEAAVWAFDPDRERLYLNLISALFTDVGRYQLRRKVSELMDPVLPEWLDESRVRLIGHDVAFALGVLGKLYAHPDLPARRIGPEVIGGVFVETGFLYEPFQSEVLQAA